MPDTDKIRPIEQITLLTNQIQWLSMRLQKINASLRASSAAGGMDDEYLDLDELREEGEEELQTIADALMLARRQLATFMNRRDAVNEVDSNVTSNTLQYLPPPSEDDE